MSATYLTPSTTTILVDSSDITAGVPKVYLASSINSIGTYFTIRDSTGNCSATKKIILSTTSGIFFTNETNLSSFEISQPFSFLTVRQKSTTEWSIINTFPFANQTYANIDIVNIGELNVSTINISNYLSSFAIFSQFISTNNLSTNLFHTSSFGINTTSPQYLLDVNGTGFISTLFTQNLGINTSTPTYSLHVEGGNSFFASTLYLNNVVFRNDPNAATLNKNDFYCTTSNIIINSSLVIQNPYTGSSNVGIRTTSPAYALDVNGTAFFGSTLTSVIGVNTSNPLYNLDVNGTGRIVSSLHNYIQVNNSAQIVNQLSTFWIAGGSETTPLGRIKKSSDGTTWSTIGSLSLANSINSFAFVSPRWVVTGNSGSNTSSLFYSDNLEDWVESPLTFTNYGNKIAWNGSLFLALGKDTTPTNTILTSPDGITWTPSLSGFGAEGKSVAWNGREWMAVGDGGGTTSSILYSSDGSNWSNISNTFFDQGGYDIAWCGTRWVAVGKSTSNYTVAISQDNSNWFPISSIFSNAGYGIGYNGKMMVAVGDGGNAISSISYSYNGINWYTIASGGFSSYGTSVAWNGSYWVATGKGGSSNSNIQFSYDGMNWSNNTFNGFTNEGNSIFHAFNPVPSLRLTNLDFFTQNIPVYLYSTNQIMTTPSSIQINNILTIGNAGVNNYTVGINNTNPVTSLDIAVNSTISGIGNYPICRSSANDTAAKNILSTSTTSNASLWPTPNGANINFYWKANTLYYKATLAGSSFFTGQHANYCTDSNINSSTVSKYVGLIVSSADKGYVSVHYDGTKITKKDAIFITEALPIIQLTNKDMDKAVFGVISNHANERVTTEGERDLDDTTIFENGLHGRIRINGLGEGAIWITNINGNLSNGDYICSSFVPGFGRKQDDDILHNYTVAKITMDCSFELNQDEYICEEFNYNGRILRKAYVGCTYHCS